MEHDPDKLRSSRQSPLGPEPFRPPLLAGERLDPGRNLPKSNMNSGFDRYAVSIINLNGNASGIYRDFFAKHLTIDQDGLTAAELSTILFGEPTDCAGHEIASWLEGSAAAGMNRMPLSFRLWRRSLAIRKECP